MSNYIVRLTAIALCLCMVTSTPLLAVADEAGFEPSIVSSSMIEQVGQDVAYKTVQAEGFSYLVPADWTFEHEDDVMISSDLYEVVHGSFGVIVTPVGNIGSEQEFVDTMINEGGDVDLVVESATQTTRTVNGVRYIDLMFEGTNYEDLPGTAYFTFAFAPDYTLIMASGWRNQDWEGIANPHLVAHASLFPTSNETPASDETSPTEPEPAPEQAAGTTEQAPVETTEFDASKYAWVSYNDIARNPDAYTGQLIAKSGPVLQVQEEDGIVVLRVATDEAWGDVIMVAYNSDIVSERILEDDFVYCYGTFQGLITYESIMGQSITIPYMICDKIERR